MFPDLECFRDMLTSQLRNWFTRRCKRAAHRDDPHWVARVGSGRRSYPPSVARHGIQVEVSQTTAEMVIRVAGDATVETAGAFLTGLMFPSTRRQQIVILDLSALRSISCLAMGVLVAYSRSVLRRGGEVRLYERLQPAVKEMLMRAEILDLFEITSRMPSWCK
jgi:anti-anti-sigma factor